MLNQAKQFIEDLKAYREPTYGLLGDSSYPEWPSGNAVLYEAHADWIYFDLPGVYRRASTIQDALDAVDVDVGLIKRKPKSDEDQAHDDYIGATSTDYPFAVRVLIRGQARGFYYDWKNPQNTFWDGIFKRKLKFWHGRFPGLVSHYRIAAGFGPQLSQLSWATWAVSILWTIQKPGNESGWLLDYLKLRCALLNDCSKHWAVRLVSWAFKRQLAKHYGGNIKGVYAVYFGAAHPFARYSDWPKL